VLFRRRYLLNHEIVQHCLGPLEKIDPSPESAPRDCAAMINRRLADNATEPECLRTIQQNLDAKAYSDYGFDSNAAAVIENHAKLGADIFPDDINAATYKKFKMLQLIKLDQGDARIHPPEHGPLKKFRANMGDITLNALRAAKVSSSIEPCIAKRIEPCLIEHCIILFNLGIIN
jgi:hypothetical protein